MVYASSLEMGDLFSLQAVVNGPDGSNAAGQHPFE